MATLKSEFQIGDRVRVKDAEDIIGVVIGLQFREYNHEVQISYFANGDVKTPWIEHFRLKHAEVA